jgi:uncharacterized cupredoxin-like copper-binding protein
MMEAVTTARDKRRRGAERIAPRWALGFVALVLTGCVGSHGTSSGGGGGDRVIRVEALDSLAFEPDSVSVEAGESVRFVVTNTGTVEHEFVLGPESVQMAHEEASGMGKEHGAIRLEGQLAALELAPGETEETVVTFEEEGEMLYGCHEPGHYDGGMVGTVTVTDSFESA